MRKTAILPRTFLALAVALTATACGLSDTPPAAPTSAPLDPHRAPADIRWEPWQGVNLPYGRTDGPSKVSEAALGYTHTPQGAALAAIQHRVRISLAPDATWARLASQALMPGPGKDAWVMARAQVSLTQPASPVMAPRITAYKFTTYTADRSNLIVYSTYSDNSITANNETVVWSSGDWRLLLPDPATKTKVVESVSEIPPDVVRLPSPT
ncbi:hypothetical protein [Nocardia sp. NPDC050406]|uniref:hypothetical protein n=1 Tax=Nocardia sp. NPDC050406 TaxID=3364318 RepID=UPI003787DCF3